jgi:predicted nucleic acid-binding protein
MAILIDTSFLLAAMYSKDANYARARVAQQSLLGKSRIVPLPVAQELFFMSVARMNYDRAIQEFERLQSIAFQLEYLVPEDLQRMTEIMRQYASASFDYADTAIMALSERLNITQIYTFDRRDFSVFRPKHCDYLELLPT